MILLDLIKRLKSIFVREEQNENLEKTTEEIHDSNKADKKITNKKNLKTHQEKQKDLFCYQRFGELKVYRRPVIKNKSKREQIFDQISKELDNIN